METCAPHDDVTNALNDARRLAAEGNYEEALQKHVLFHDHVLEARASYYGVRLSFALSAWVDLGEKYPKARKVLIETRDKKANQLQSGNQRRDLFHDVTSINHYLKEPHATVALFKHFAELSPEFAATIYNLAEGALVEAGEYTLARRYLGDPLSKLADAKETFREGIEFSKSRSDRRESAKRAYERIFTEDVLRLLTILKNTGNVPAARTIQSEALRILDNPQLRDALGNP